MVEVLIGSGFTLTLTTLGIIYRNLNANDARLERKIDRINGQILEHAERLAKVEVKLDA